MAFQIPGYDATERTRLSLIIPSDGGGAPRKIVSAPSESWHEIEAQLEALQLAYIHERNRSGEGASTFAEGQVADETGQMIARVSYNARVNTLRRYSGTWDNDRPEEGEDPGKGQGQRRPGKLDAASGCRGSSRGAAGPGCRGVHPQ